MTNTTYITITLKEEVFICGELELEQDFNSHHTFRLWITAEQGKEWEHYEELAEKFIGERIVVQYWRSSDMKELQNQFAGIVGNADLVCNQGEEVYVEISGHGLSVILDSVVTTRAFCDASLQDFKSRIMQDLGQQADKLVCINSKHANKAFPYLVQYNESGYSLLKRLASENGEWFFFDGRQLQYGKPKAPPAETELTVGVDIWGFKLMQSIQYMGFSLSSYNPHQDKRFEAAAGDQQVALEKKGKIGSVITDRSAKLTNQQISSFVTGAVDTVDELRERVLGMKQQMAAKLQVVRGSSKKPALWPGHCIVVKRKAGKGTRQALGKYVIIKIKHRYNWANSTYTNTFEAVDVNAEAIPDEPLQRQGQGAVTDRAKVHDTNDPEGGGRVRVEFEWKDDPRLSAWIPVNTIQAGATKDGKQVRGIFMLPEKGDTVLIAYEYGDPRYPFVVGGSYNKQTAKIEKGDLEENNAKRIATSGGSHITIVDRKNNKLNQLTIGINEDPLITITDDGKQKTITLQTKDEIILKTDTIRLAGKNISLEADGTLELNADEIKSKAGKTLKLEAGSVQLEAKTNAEFKGKAIAMEATGPMKIKGAMIGME